MRFFTRSKPSPPPPAPDTWTLGHLVARAADDPTPAHRDAVFGALLFAQVGVQTEPSDQPRPAGEHVAYGEDRPGIPSVELDDGNTYLAVLCDIPALAAAFPKAGFVELDARVVLEMARDNGLGVIVRNALEPSQPWVAVPKERVADVLGGRYVAMVTVPPGHKVVTVASRPDPSFGPLESGFWVADLGSGDALDVVIAEVRQHVEAHPDTNLSWVVQPMLLESSTALNVVTDAIMSIARTRGSTAGQIVVTPYASEKDRAPLRRLRDCDVPVHYGGPNGECFIEVHRPDGTITVGLPGPAFEGQPPRETTLPHHP